MQNIIKVDHENRRKKLALYAIAITYLMLLIFWGFPTFSEYLENSMNPKAALKWVRLTIIFVLIPFVILSVAGFGVGRRTLKSGQYPPPGANVMLDTEIVTGTKAKWIAVLFIVQFFIITFFVFYCGIYIPNMLEASLEYFPPQYAF